MKLSRRDFLKLGSAAALAGSAAGCSQIGQELVQQELPESLALPTAVSTTLSEQAAELPVIPVDRVRRFLNRAGYGPRPGDVEKVREIGLESYLEQQLNPEALDDQAADLFIRNLYYYNMSIDELLAFEREDAASELAQATFYRALYSKRQLYEAMVEFWSDHFNIYLAKNQKMPFFKVLDDREVIRPHALGKFRDLLWASAKSPAMLIYLDNIRNTVGNPNENYARELMELHTLGVNGGYDQTDVQELARVLTGWGVKRRGRQSGKTIFTAQQHDSGAKQIINLQVAADQGEEELDQVLEMLVTHPSTANFIATKLVRRFIADDPPVALVESVAAIYLESDGDIKQMLRHIFLSGQFATAAPKLKRPYSYLVSALRALHVDVGSNVRLLGRWLRLMGQPLFFWPPPDGYPDVATAWATNLLPRWNFALALTSNSLERAEIPLDALLEAGGVESATDAATFFSRLLLGQEMDSVTTQLFVDYIGDGAFDKRATQLRLREALALVLAAPAFQWT